MSRRDSYNPPDVLVEGIPYQIEVLSPTILLQRVSSLGRERFNHFDKRALEYLRGHDDQQSAPLVRCQVGAFGLFERASTTIREAVLGAIACRGLRAATLVELLCFDLQWRTQQQEYLFHIIAYGTELHTDEDTGPLVANIDRWGTYQHGLTLDWADRVIDSRVGRFLATQP